MAKARSRTSASFMVLSVFGMKVARSFAAVLGEIEDEDALELRGRSSTSGWRSVRTVSW